MIVAFIFCVLIVRFVFLQVVDSKTMQIRAVEQWVRTLPLTAKRGQIVDTNGNILAISYTSYDVFVRAKEIKNPAEVASFLSVLLQENFDKVYQKTINTHISEVLVKLQINETTAKKIVERNLDGVYLAENIKRYYPYGKTLCQVLGFLTIDSVGQSGAECYFEHILCGKDGKFLTQSDVKGITLNNSLNYYVQPVEGLNIALNIDVNIQVAVEKTLEQLVADHHPKNVSAIVMDPATSKILALAIHPSFSLNDVPRGDVASLLEMTKNLTITNVYEPGSTFKILTLAAALSENLTSLDEHFYCPGYRMVSGEKIKCWKTTGHGDQTLVEAVQNSCNCCFMDLALRLGKEKFYKYLNLFGIGTPSGIDMLGESSGILLDENLVKEVDLARIGFGQTIAVNQIQLANAFCSVINGGILNTPSILKNYFDENNYEVFDNKTLSKSTTISPEISNTILYLLEQALSKTGQLSFVEGFKIGGKTGTAQKYGENGQIVDGKYVSSFYGFLIDEGVAKYAILLCVDEPSSGTYYGSLVAKPYAKIIFEEIIKYKNIKKFDENYIEEKFTVPNFLGLSLSTAMVEIEKLKLNFEVDGEGERVISQFPSPDTVVPKSTTILIKTK